MEKGSTQISFTQQMTLTNAVGKVQKAAGTTHETLQKTRKKTRGSQGKKITAHPGEEREPRERDASEKKGYKRKGKVELRTWDQENGGKKKTCYNKLGSSDPSAYEQTRMPAAQGNVAKRGEVPEKTREDKGPRMGGANPKFPASRGNNIETGKTKINIAKLEKKTGIRTPATQV